MDRPATSSRQQRRTRLMRPRRDFKAACALLALTLLIADCSGRRPGVGAGEIPAKDPPKSPPAGAGIALVSSHQISVDNATHPHAESYIAVDPKDPKHLLATAIVVVNGESRAYPYASFDGGKSWTRGKIVGDASIVMGGDPIVYLNSAGTAFFVTLAPVKDVERSVIARSTDGGRTWNTTTLLPFADRQWMAFDSGGGPFGGRAYFTGTGIHGTHDGARAASPYLARSDDDGQTFPMRSVVAYDRAGAAPHAPINAIPLEPLVASRGLFVLPLQGSVDEPTRARLARDSLTARRVGLVASGDGGESFGPARYAPVQHTTLTGSPERRFRALSAFGCIRTASDASTGRFRNRIYFVAPDYDASIDRYVVRLWFTSDLGKTWHTVTTSDAPKGDVANPAIAVNRRGGTP